MQTRIIKLLIIAAIPVFGAGCDRQVSFTNQVKPILTSNCMKCHDGTGEGSKKSGFNVTSYETLMKGTKFGPVIVPGDSSSSTLFRLVAHKADPKIQMPPHHQASMATQKLDPLTKKQISTIKAWINQGAKNI